MDNPFIDIGSNSLTHFLYIHTISASAPNFVVKEVSQLLRLSDNRDRHMFAPPPHPSR
jgi:hypothetical protein